MAYDISLLQLVDKIPSQRTLICSIPSPALRSCSTAS